MSGGAIDVRVESQLRPGYSVGACLQDAHGCVCLVLPACKHTNVSVDATLLLPVSV